MVFSDVLGTFLVLVVQDAAIRAVRRNPARSTFVLRDRVVFDFLRDRVLTARDLVADELRSPAKKENLDEDKRTMFGYSGVLCSLYICGVWPGLR